MKKYSISFLIFTLLISPCIAQQKYKLRLDGIYYCDNKKDTVIKNYDLYQDLKDNRAFDDRFNPPDKGVVYMPGSRIVDLLRFYKDSTVYKCFMVEDFDIDKANKIIEWNRTDEIAKGIMSSVLKYTLSINQVFYEMKFPKMSGAFSTDDKGGNSWNEEKKIMYTGTIMQDSIKFITTFNLSPGSKYLDDTIKVFHFVPFK